MFSCPVNVTSVGTPLVSIAKLDEPPRLLTPDLN